MKNTSRKPYIYKVTNLETHQYYIGSQCSGKTIGMNYFTSSTNKEFKEGFKTYREEKYEITIIKEFEDPKKCGRVENYIIRNYMQKRDGLCLNRAYHCNGKKVFSAVGIHHTPWNKGIPSSKKGIPRSEETKQKISITKKGIPLSEEVKQKISEALKGLPTWNKGIHHTEETKQKMSEAKKGHPSPFKGIHHTEETKQKISIAKKMKISLEGEVFDSITDASKYYNVGKSTIRRWAKTKKHNAFYIEKCPKI